MRLSTILVGCVAALSAAAPAAAYISSPLALGRPAAHLGGHAGLAPRARARSSAPSMQLNPQDKTFRRSVALRAEGDDEQKLPAGSPLGSGQFGNEPEFSYNEENTVNPAYFVLGGIMGCVPIAYWLVQSCQVSIGTKLAQCPQ